MSQIIDGVEYSIKDLELIRQQQLDILEKDKGNADAICELVCADALLCEEYTKDWGPNWLNADLCKEICKYIDTIVEMPDCAEMAENVCDRAAECLYDHPRLKLRLLLAQRDAVIAQGDDRAEAAEMGIDELSARITKYQLNIAAADEERWDDIEKDGLLKHDPIEWTEAYENVISQAQAKANERLKDVPRAMGFCFELWHTLAEILLTDYNIRWRSPHQMNPSVIFD